MDVADGDRVAYLSQTTLAVDEVDETVASLRERFPSLAGPGSDDICYATQNRQDAVKFMAPRCDLLIVVGSPNSSNSNRLREVAKSRGTESYMVDNASELKTEWVQGRRHVGVTAGASAPEVLVQEVVDRLRELGAVRVSQIDGIEENVTFPLPKALSAS